jgi:hypothetical protein
MSGWLIEQHQRCVTQDGTTERDPLSLTGAQGEPALSDRGFDALWQPVEQLGEPREFARTKKCPGRGFRVPDPEIVGDRAA